MHILQTKKLLSLKVIGSDVHTSVYDKRDDFGFPIVNFPWLSGDVPRLPSYGVYNSQLIRFAWCYTIVSDFNSKNLQITSKLLKHGYRYHKLSKTYGKLFRSYSDLLSKFGEISFQGYVTEGITHPVFIVANSPPLEVNTPQSAITPHMPSPPAGPTKTKIFIPMTHKLPNDAEQAWFKYNKS